MVAAILIGSDIKCRHAAPAPDMTHKQWFWAAALVGYFALAALIPKTAASTPIFTSNATLQENSAGIAAGGPSRPDALDRYLERLAFEFECVGACKNVEEYKRLDSNGRYSYDCLQFQEQTWLSFARRYGVDPWKNGGIYQCENQLKVARLMFEDGVEAAARHWYTSIYKRGLGLPNI